jgi:hypothetical protein
MKIIDNSVPPGVYTCSFDGTEETTHEQYGDGLLWRFIVERGRFRDRMVTRTTKTEATLKNSCGAFLAALAGRAPSDGLEIDPADYEGRRYICTVAATKNGGTRVESFVREQRLEEDQPDERDPNDEMDEAAAHDDDVPFDVPT